MAESPHVLLLPALQPSEDEQAVAGRKRPAKERASSSRPHGLDDWPGHLEPESWRERTQPQRGVTTADHEGHAGGAVQQGRGSSISVAGVVRCSAARAPSRRAVGR